MSTLRHIRFDLRTTLGYCTVFLILSLLVYYISYQARFITTGPIIDLATNEVVSENRTVILAGKAQNITHIEINGRPIYTDERGYFKETLVLENGYTIATVRAFDRFGRSTAISRPFVYKPTVTDNS
jgi:Na+-transporting methylmalonyl-CoA/oxaloacetate decarboxylase gamma subunit